MLWKSLKIRRVGKQAARWFVRLHSKQLSTADFVKFQTWLDADWENQFAYARQEELWDTLSRFSEMPEILIIRENIR